MPTLLQTMLTSTVMPPNHEESEPEGPQEEACRLLCEALEEDNDRSTENRDNDTDLESKFWSFAETWTREFDMNETIEKDEIMNHAHIFGQALSTFAYQALGNKLTEFDLPTSLDTYAASICIHDLPLHKMSWQQTQDVILSLQINFNSLFECDPDEGFGCYVDINLVLGMLMAHIGFLESHKWKLPSQNSSGQSPQQPPEQSSKSNPMSGSIEVLHGVVDIDEEGWEYVREESMVFVLDALHAMLNAKELLFRAQAVPTSMHIDSNPNPNFLFNFHREASLDDFYDLSMISDCPTGSILQYRHKFRYLFHSVSQVIFFHYPTYDRQKQIPMQELQKRDIPQINLLPLLLQVKTDIPILTEHTGMGTRAKHTETPWSWAIVGKFALLVNNNLETYFAQDLRDLILYVDPNIVSSMQEA